MTKQEKIAALMDIVNHHEDFTWGDMTSTIEVFVREHCAPLTDENQLLEYIQDLNSVVEVLRINASASIQMWANHNL